MNKTYEKEPSPSPEYRKAEVGETPDMVPKTDSAVPEKRSIVTSRTEGTIEVIIINKSLPTPDTDKSTS